ncbi:MAG: RluA family pseudouridine synthase [Oscillospiraceae bacterium]
MQQGIYYIVEKEMILQDFLMNEKGHSHRQIVALKKGGILVNGQKIRMIDKVNIGDKIQIEFKQTCNLVANYDLIVPIEYEDDFIIVYNKPENMPTHPSRDHLSDTLANAFCAYIKDTTFRPINRLDRDTCGLCVVAKNPYVASRLSKNIQKKYCGIISGHMKEKTGEINAPIFREDYDTIKRVVDERGKPSITQYKVISENEKYSLVSFTLLTGRTHQIRVHMSYMGVALAGDSIYGGDNSDFLCHVLCCNYVQFYHPITNKKIEISIPMPEKYQNLFKN